MSELINTRVDDGVGLVVLNRPERRNALSIQVREELSDILDAWAVDDAVRAVVVTGAGQVFCAGFDLEEFGDRSKSAAIAESSRRYHLTLWSFPKPTVAAVNGHALAGGLDLATLCDVRIAADTATFGHPEIKFGAPPLFTPLRWIVGAGLARDLCLTGRRIDAAEACRIGLVSRVVPAGDTVDDAVAVARTILEAPQAALEMTKSYLVGTNHLGFEESFAVEHDSVFARFLQAGGGS